MSEILPQQRGIPLRGRFLAAHVGAASPPPRRRDGRYSARKAALVISLFTALLWGMGAAAILALA